MDISRLILLTLSGGLAGCPSTWNCNPDSAPLNLDEPVTAAALRSTMKDYGFETVADVDCSAVCRVVYRQDEGWEATVDRCTLSLAEDLDLEGAEEAAVVGQVSCAGTGYAYFCEGRRPLGHVEAAAPAGGIAAWLRACAALESASVLAFEQLAQQLAGWGAPAALIERCGRAAREEARHAQVVADLAGTLAPVPGPPPAADGDLFQAALHNATEGCVFEAWAALTALQRSRSAADSAIRQAYGPIAVDEAGHAQLAWDLQEWMLSRLDAEAQDRVLAAQDEALARLPAVAAHQAERSPPGLGSVRPAQAAALAARFAAGLRAQRPALTA